MTYAFWNNKGGVGKSTITFHTATRFAELNPNMNVLVIDMCPQSNVSMMLLGGGQQGENTVINEWQNQQPRTVVGYLTTVISNGPGAALPNPNAFAMQVSQTNARIPNNLHLLCGDGNLESIAPAITSQANAQPLGPTHDPWVWIYNIFRSYISEYKRINGDSSTVVFIDTNPAFGVYTQLAITASDRLICPVNADDSSRAATTAMILLLHGSVPPHPVFGQYTFAAMANQRGLNIPKIHLMIGNRLTQYAGAARAFRALSDSTSRSIYNQYVHFPQYFTNRINPPQNLADFRNEYSVALRDFNTAGVVSAHRGHPLSILAGGNYQVAGRRIQVNSPRVTECIAAIDEVIDKF